MQINECPSDARDDNTATLGELCGWQHAHDVDPGNGGMQHPGPQQPAPTRLRDGAGWNSRGRRFLARGERGEFFFFCRRRRRNLMLCSTLNWIPVHALRLFCIVRTSRNQPLKTCACDSTLTLTAVALALLPLSHLWNYLESRHSPQLKSPTSF